MQKQDFKEVLFFYVVKQLMKTPSSTGGKRTL